MPYLKKNLPLPMIEAAIGNALESLFSSPTKNAILKNFFQGIIKTGATFVSISLPLLWSNRALLRNRAWKTLLKNNQNALPTAFAVGILSKAIIFIPRAIFEVISSYRSISIQTLAKAAINKVLPFLNNFSSAQRVALVEIALKGPSKSKSNHIARNSLDLDKKFTKEEIKKLSSKDFLTLRAYCSNKVKHTFEMWRYSDMTSEDIENWSADELKDTNIARYITDESNSAIFIAFATACYDNKIPVPKKKAFRHTDFDVDGEKLLKEWQIPTDLQGIDKFDNEAQSGWINFCAFNTGCDNSFSYGQKIAWNCVWNKTKKVPSGTRFNLTPSNSNDIKLIATKKYGEEVASQLDRPKYYLRDWMLLSPELQNEIKQKLNELKVVEHKLPTSYQAKGQEMDLYNLFKMAYTGAALEQDNVTEANINTIADKKLDILPTSLKFFIKHTDMEQFLQELKQSEGSFVLDEQKIKTMHPVNFILLYGYVESCKNINTNIVSCSTNEEGEILTVWETRREKLGLLQIKKVNVKLFPKQ